MLPQVELFDAHTHVGFNDPDGNSQSPEQLVGVLEQAGACGAFYFPMHEPDGYPPANDWVLEVAAEHHGPVRLVPFCRVDPNRDAPAEARRCIAAGARGIKLHPRAEQFQLDHPAVRELFQIAQEHTLPVLVHAGRGIPALGRHLVSLCAEFPSARAILAHAGITDLAWIWRDAANLGNLLFDTSWFMPADLLALYSLVPPGQILYASDAPYGNPSGGRAAQLRIALQAGLSEAQIRCVFAEQSLRIAGGEPLLAVGPAVGERQRAPHLLLDRVGSFLLPGTLMTIRGQPDDAAQMLNLARLACEVPDGHDDAPVMAQIGALLDAYDPAPLADGDRSPISLLLLAMTVAATPDVPVPNR